MAQISVNHVTFCYEGSYDNIFEDVSFQIDTDWRLGLIGRNGRGKTTFLRLLMAELEYEGSIKTNIVFDYFPYRLRAEYDLQNAVDVLYELSPECELWRVLCELEQVKLDAEVLYRPFGQLSKGEQTKLMLALLFSQENHFLLIDEPTNHLDIQAREVVRDYLSRKSGFILVSHDRRFLDACIDHVLVINKNSMEVERGNFSSWWENKEKRDAFELAENEKLKKEIGRLQAAARRTALWADKVEATKIGFDPVKEHDRFLNTRSYIGMKSKRMQQRRKNLERRQENAIEEKSRLLKNIETAENLKLKPLHYHKSVLIEARDLALSYSAESAKPLFEGVRFRLEDGQCLAIQGRNGAGKSSIVRAILAQTAVDKETGINIPYELSGWDTLCAAGTEEAPQIISGELRVPAGLIVSYVSQDTSFLRGSIKEYAEKRKISEPLLFALLRKLDFERVQFEKPMESYSEGQKKKVLLAGSLCEQAHLYIWDEPLNFIDVFSRMQLEALIKTYRPTMLLIEHDEAFIQEIGADVLRL
ncbi:MAG: ATP-binding cassette domain-containing protein [Lachnospiraceae bacterium]|nr:ATP-binding cassette domain-containing protein [Lachnospiraceae bacterium]